MSTPSPPPFLNLTGPSVMSPQSTYALAFVLMLGTSALCLLWHCRAIFMRMCGLNRRQQDADVESPSLEQPVTGAPTYVIKQLRAFKYDPQALSAKHGPSAARDVHPRRDEPTCSVICASHSVKNSGPLTHGSGGQCPLDNSDQGSTAGTQCAAEHAACATADETAGRSAPAVGDGRIVITIQPTADPISGALPSQHPSKAVDAQALHAYGIVDAAEHAVDAANSRGCDQQSRQPASCCSKVTAATSGDPGTPAAGSSSSSSRTSSGRSSSSSSSGSSSSSSSSSRDKAGELEVVVQHDEVSDAGAGDQPTARYESLRDDQGSCVVCFEDYQHGELLKELPCGHWYHAACIDAWLKRNATCPLCKHVVWQPLPADVLPLWHELLRLGVVTPDFVMARSRSHGAQNS